MEETVVDIDAGLPEVWKPRSAEERAKTHEVLARVQDKATSPEQKLEAVFGGKEGLAKARESAAELAAAERLNPDK